MKVPLAMSLPRLSSRCIRALAAAIAVCLAADSLQAETIRQFRVAIRGRLAVPGASYLIFGDIDIDSLGRVLYTTSLTDGRSAIFSEDRGKVTPLLFSFDEVPDRTPDRFEVFIEVSGNASGDVAFIAATFLGQGQQVFLLRDGVISRIAGTGDSVPDPAGDRFVGFDQVQLLDDGSLYFSATIAGAEGERRGIYRTQGGETQAAIVPGRRYFGTRVVQETLQYDVNEQGSIAALTLVIDADALAPGDPLSEMVLESGGVLRTIASSEFTLAGGIEAVRHFAITFDQVHVDGSGAASFFASTTQHLLGGVFVNTSGRFLGNAHAVAQGDPAPTGAGDRFREFGPFDRSAAGTLVFTATTDRRPAGGFFLQKDGAIHTLGLVGAERPGGVGLWTGFLMAEINGHDEFVLTDRDGLIQTGVFRGRIVPDLPDLLATIRGFATAPGLDPATRAALQRRIVLLVTASQRKDPRLMARQASQLRDWLKGQTDRIEPRLLIRLDILLDDLIHLLSGP